MNCEKWIHELVVNFGELAAESDVDGEDVAKQIMSKLESDLKYEIDS